MKLKHIVETHFCMIACATLFWFCQILTIMMVKDSLAFHLNGAVIAVGMVWQGWRGDFPRIPMTTRQFLLVLAAIVGCFISICWMAMVVDPIHTTIPFHRLFEGTGFSLWPNLDL